MSSKNHSNNHSNKHSLHSKKHHDSSNHEARVRDRESKTSQTPEKTAHHQNNKKDLKNSPSSEMSATQTIKQLLTNPFSKIFGILLVLVLLMGLAYEIRTGPVDFEGGVFCSARQVFDNSVVCGFEENVRNSILQQIQQQIAVEVQQQFPNLDQQMLQQEVANRFRQVLQTNTFQGQNIDELVRIQYQEYIRNFQFESGVTYIGDIDTYFFMNEGTNVMQNGHRGTTIDENGTPINELQRAPQGLPKVGVTEMHSQVIAWLYQLHGVDPVNPSVEERTKAFFTLSAILAMLAVIPFFFFMKFATNTPFAIISSILFTTSSMFVARTQAGYVSTDGYIILFSVLTVALLYLALRQQNQIFRILTAIGAAISITLLLWAWTPGTYLVVFTLAALLAPIGYEVILYLKKLYTNYKQSKENSSKPVFSVSSFVNDFPENFKATIVALTYYITATVLQIIFFSRELVYFTINDTFRRIDSLAGIASTDIWPNVLSSVAELRNTPIREIFSQLLISESGATMVIILLGLSLTGMFAYLISHINFKKVLPTYNSNIIKWSINVIASVYYFFVLFNLQDLTINYPIVFLGLLFVPILIGLLVKVFDEDIKTSEVFLIAIIAIWFSGGVFMSLNGARFLLLLAPIFVILVTYGLYRLLFEIVELLKLEFKEINVPSTHLVLSVLVALTLFSISTPQIDRGFAMTNSNIPNFDDGWYELMEFIQSNTSEDAIINSWWDFGHFFTAVGQRGVHFDGATQQTPAAYWVGNWLLTDNELRAVNIKRMLSCSLNQGFEFIDEIFVEEMNDQSRGVHAFNVVDELMNLTRDEKEEYLQDYERFNFTQEQIDEILHLVHCEEPRQILAITSGDMIGKAGVWAHWGLWNPTKKFVLDNYQRQSVEEMSSILEVNESEISRMVQELQSIDTRAQNLGLSRTDLRNQWLAPYPGYLSQPFECQFQNDIVNCQNQFLINLTNPNNITTQGRLTDGADVSRIIIPTMFGLETYELNQDEGLDILVTPSNNMAQLLVAQYPLGTSMFTRLYFLQGFGTTNYDLLKTVNTIPASRVTMWDVNFDETNISSSDDSGFSIDIGDIIFEEQLPQENENIGEVEEIEIDLDDLN